MLISRATMKTELKGNKMKKKPAMKGKQSKLDANKDGKISKEDFAMLRNKKKKA